MFRFFNQPDTLVCYLPLFFATSLWRSYVFSCKLPNQHRNQ